MVPKCIVRPQNVKKKMNFTVVGRVRMRTKDISHAEKCAARRLKSGEAKRRDTFPFSCENAGKTYMSR